MKLDAMVILSGLFLSPGFDLMQARNTAGYELTKTAHAGLGLCTLPFNAGLAGASKPALSPSPIYIGPVDPTKPSIWTRNSHQSSWNRAQASFNAFSQASLPAPCRATSTLGMGDLSYPTASYHLPPYDPKKSSVHPQNGYWSYRYALLFKSPPEQVVAKILYEHWCNVYETDQDNAEDEVESVCLSDDDGNVRYIGNGYSSDPRDSESEFSYDDDITRLLSPRSIPEFIRVFATEHVQHNDNGYFSDSSSEYSYDENLTVTTVTSIDTDIDLHFGI